MTTETCFQVITLILEPKITDKFNKMCPESLPKWFWPFGSVTTVEYIFIIQNRTATLLLLVSKIKCYQRKRLAYQGKTDFRIKELCYQLIVKLQHRNFSLAKVTSAFQLAPGLKGSLSALPRTRFPLFQTCLNIMGTQLIPVTGSCTVHSI